MNYNTAIKLLDLDKESINESSIKKKYKFMALKYHPDKNKSINATNKFSEIKDAYEYLMKYEGHMDTDDEYFEEEKDDKNYNSLLYQFINTILNENSQDNILNGIIKNIIHMCEDKTINYLKTIDKSNLIKLYDFFHNYNQIFHHSNQFIEKVKELVKEKTKHDEVIILNPTLNDLFEQNIYKLYYNDNFYYIPLWQPEVKLDLSNNELYVKNIPKLPENIKIDNKNNIIIKHKFNIINLWENPVHKINICKSKTFYINSENLLIKKKQILHLPNKGIPKTISNDVFNVSKLSDVFIHIEIDN